MYCWYHQRGPDIPSRTASKEWPEKKYCNSTGSFFLCHLWAGFGSRALGRMVANDAELVGRLREGLRPERFPGKGIRDIIVQDVDYNGSADHTQILQFLVTMISAAQCAPYSSDLITVIVCLQCYLSRSKSKSTSQRISWWDRTGRDSCRTYLCATELRSWRYVIYVYVRMYVW